MNALKSVARTQRVKFIGPNMEIHGPKVYFLWLYIYKVGALR